MWHVWYAIGVVVIFARWTVRIRTVGVRGLDGDDLFSIPFLALWTINAFIVYATYYSGGNIDVTAEQAEQLSDRDVWVLEYGSKWEFASFFTYCATIWCLKFMVLFFYRRLKADEWRQTVLTVKRLFWINGLAYLALFLTAMLGCRPHRCTFRPQNFWVLVVLNVLTDALIMTIPVPILWQLRVSRLRKVGVSLLLCSGVFVISTAVKASHGTSKQTELSKLSRLSRPGNTRDLDQGPDTMSGAIEMQAVEPRAEQEQDDLAISPTRGVG
ncbi:putative mg2+ transporter zinc transport protein [Diaporthe ampelina]|uniref:Putative mg2+ transporter zinc transport protein n=1 Tax=Diaporthe ampelina TaxID=1214573 RepID=A0A0G2F9Z1_9PEZI|nr:putative mg2+ transporter zinc transport protein [Diaporthe ampelina]